jgi:hypothetical protein
MSFRSKCVVLSVGVFVGTVVAQEAPMPHLSPGSARKPTPAGEAKAPEPQSVALTVPKGTPLQIALDGEVRVQKVGQTIHGRIVQPVYAFGGKAHHGGAGCRLHTGAED